MRRAATLIGIATALALVPASAAGASTVAVVSISGTDYILFTASPGADNNVTVQNAGSTYAVSDTAATVTASTGCTQAGPSAATCPQSGIGSIRVQLGDGNDTASTTASQNIYGYGGDGNDVLNGGSQGDILQGDAGDDTITGSGGPDWMEGGAGTDRVIYAGRVQPVRVDLDGAYDDGEFNEFDNVGTDVEEVVGGDAADTFVGTSGPNIFRGGPGNDVIDGMDGDDALFGDAGNDHLEGRGGTDSFAGGDGDDTVSARDNGTAESIDCGIGTDGATADREDTATGCETLDVPAALATPAAAPATPPAAPKEEPAPAWNFPAPQAPIANVVTIVQRQVAVSRTGAIAIRLSCGDEQVKGCKGKIVLTALVPKGQVRSTRRSGPANKIVLARKRFTLRRGRAAAVRARATRSALRRVFTRGRRKVPATMSVTMRNSDGSTTTITKPISVTAANLNL
jgi:hypothetical protein